MNDKRQDPRPKQELHLAAVGGVFLFLVSLWAGALWFVDSTRQDALEHARQSLARMELAVEDQLRRRLQLVEVSLRGARLWIEQHPGDDPRRDPRFLAIADEVRHGNSRGVGFGFVSEQGEFFLHGRDSGRPMSPQADAGNLVRVALAASQAVPQFGAPQRGPGASRSLPIALRLPANAQNLAVALAVIDLAELEAQLGPQRPGAGGSLSLVRRDGLLLAHLPHADVLFGKSLADGALFKTLLPQKARDSAIYRADEFDGRERVTAYSALPDLPLVVVVSASVDEVLAGWGRQRQAVLGATAAITLLALFALVHLFRLSRRLVACEDDLRRLANNDPLTGALNHGSFMDLIEREFARSQRYRQPMAVMMLDIDFFKRINDGYGHAVGDEALRDLVATLSDGLRTLDAVGRLGGEEFAILLPNTPGQSGLALADRLRERVAGIVVRASHGESVRFTISLGVTGLDAADTSAEQMLARADGALAQAKANGRNRVEFVAVDEADRVPAPRGGAAADAAT